MAAIDITIDEVIRRQLAMRGLSLHYYLPMLLFARRGLDEMQYNSLQRVKYVVLPVNPNFEVYLPSDVVEVIDVTVENGDKIKSMGHNDRINPRDTSGVAFNIGPSQYAMDSLDMYQQWSPNVYTEYGANKGRMFGANVQFYDSYTYNRDLNMIRIDNKSTVTSVTVCYLSTPNKNVTSQSVIHPFAQNAMIEYLNWKWDEYNKHPDYPNRRKEFYNQYRILRGMMSKLTTVEIMRSMRRHINLAIKN